MSIGSPSFCEATEELLIRPEVPDGDQWRIAALHKLLSARLTADYECDKIEVERVQELIDFICIN